jgi:thiosulfate dehydrogenase [quinone] large subunit
MSDSLPPTKVMAYALLRVAFGVNFAGHGFVRILNGVGSFADTTASHMAKSVMPRELVVGFAYAVPFIEAALGLALILGVLTRVSLVCGALFMMVLTIGVTSNQQWDVAGQQLLYSVAFFLLLYLVELNGYSVDAVLQCRRSSSQVKPNS